MSTSSGVALSRDLFDNPHTWQKVARAYEPKGLAVSTASTALATLIANVLQHYFPVPSRGGGALACWSLALVLLPLTAFTGSLLRARRRQAFHAMYWVQSLAQFVWLQALCWYTTPFFSIAGAAMFCTWAFHDAFIAYDSPLLRVQYGIAFLAFDSALLALDAFGGHGLRAAWRDDRAAVEAMLSVQASLALIAQIIIGYAGAEAYEHDRRMVEAGERERDLAAMRAERRVLRASSVYLAHGLTATKLCHDVASPLTAALGISNLEDLLTAPPLEGPEARALLAPLAPAARDKLLALVRRWNDDAREIVDDVALAVTRIHEMTRATATSLRSAGTPEPTPASKVVADAVKEMHLGLKGYGVTAPDPVVTLEEADVAVIDGHASTLGNLLVNGVLQRPEEPLEVRGRALDAWFYHLSIRDHGVAPEERDAALAHIRVSLALEARGRRDEPGTSQPPRHRGYGIALMVSKVLLLRFGGHLGVSAPPSGRGVVLDVVLPRVPPDQIPPDRNQPEALLADATPTRAPATTPEETP